MNKDNIILADSLSSSLPTIEHYFTSTVLSVYYSSLKGRYVCANRDIEKGGTILVAQAIAKGVQDSHKKRVCDYCLRYNHQGAYTTLCLHCRQVYYCSPICKSRAEQQELKEEDKIEQENRIADSGIPASSIVSLSSTPCPIKPPIPHHAHTAAECNELKLIARLKTDKETVGLLKLLVRLHCRMQNTSSSEPTSTPQPLISPAFPHPVHIPIASDIPLLISHAPTSAASLHAHEWKDMQRLTSRLVHGAAYMQLLGAVEANAFGLYAPPAASPSTQSNDVEAAANSLETLTIHPSSTAHSASEATTAEPEELSTKYIGRALYPAASYFNHSCRPNAEVVQKGHYLYVRALCSIAAGEEVCISYIDADRPTRERRALLHEQYYFHCICDRCQADECNSRQKKSRDKEKEKEKERQKYSTRTYVHRKQKPKKKMLEAIVHSYDHDNLLDDEQNEDVQQQDVACT